MNWRNVSKAVGIVTAFGTWTVIAGIDEAQPPWGSACTDTDGDGYGDPGSVVCPSGCSRRM